MKNSVHFLIVLMASATFTACGSSKRTVGIQEGPPTVSADEENPVDAVNDEDQAGDDRDESGTPGIPDGPRPLIEENEIIGDEAVPSSPVNSQSVKPGSIPDNAPEDDEEIQPPVVGQKPVGQITSAPRAAAPRANVTTTTLRPRQNVFVPPTITQNPSVAPSNLWLTPGIAGTPAEGWLVYDLNPLLSHLRSQAPSPTLIGKRVMITIALGYMDGYHQKPLKFAGVDYGMSAAVDPFLRSAIEDILLRGCDGSSLQVCGFRRGSTNGSETIFYREGRAGFVQEIRLISGAVAPELKVTTGRRAEEQSRRTKANERLFSKAFEDSDLVIYIGHSRQKVGPDFGAPVVVAGKANLQSDRSAKEGLRRLSQSLNGRSRKARSVVLLSSFSSGFRLDLKRDRSELEVVTVNRKVTMEMLTAAGISAADLFLRQGSVHGISDFVSSQSSLRGALERR